MQCAICGSQDCPLHHPRVFGLPGSRVYRCTRCATAFVHPYLSEAEIAAFYADYNSYMVDRQMFATPPDPARVFAFGQREGRERVRLLQRFIKRRRILEVGCSVGCFLVPAAGVAREVAGVEPDPANRAHAAQRSGGRVWTHIGEVEGRYQTILLFHVLEHVVDPVPFLERLRTLLTGRGVLVLELPNLDDALVSRYAVEAFKEFYFQKEHPFYYNAGALKGLLGRAGYRLVWEGGRQRYGLANHLRWLKEGKPGGWPELEPLLAKADPAYRRALLEGGVADTLLMAFRPHPSPPGEG